jgi:hypothetical protein
MKRTLAYNNDDNVAFYGTVQAGKIDFETAAQMLLFGAESDSVDAFRQWINEHPILARESRILVRIPIEATFNTFDQHDAPADSLHFARSILAEFEKLDGASTLFNHVIFSRRFLLFWSEFVFGAEGHQDLPQTPTMSFFRSRFSRTTTERNAWAATWWYTSMRCIMMSGGHGVVRKITDKTAYSDQDPILRRMYALGCDISLLVGFESDYYERAYCNAANTFYQSIEPLFNLIEEPNGLQLTQRRIERIWTRFVENVTNVFGRMANAHFSSFASSSSSSSFGITKAPFAVKSPMRETGWTRSIIANQMIEILKLMLTDTAVEMRVREFATITDEHTVVVNKMMDLVQTDVFAKYECVSDIPRQDYVARALFKHIRRSLAGTVLCRPPEPIHKSNNNNNNKRKSSTKTKH